MCMETGKETGVEKRDRTEKLNMEDGKRKEEISWRRYDSRQRKRSLLEELLSDHQ